MTKQVIRRRASDNTYLHKDFHGALSAGIDYLDEHFGESSVLQYLHRFTRTFYAPLRHALAERGLEALQEHFAALYELEDGDAEFELSDNELIVRVVSCPAVRHMRRHGYPVARLFHETTRTVNEALCEGSEYGAELVDYDPDTGRSVQRFYRRAP